MSATVFVQNETTNFATLVNDSGADLVQGEFAVIDGFNAIATGDIASTEEGSFDISEGRVIHTNEFESGEDTFATPGAIAYWNNTTKLFSDTSTSGYYVVGRVLAVKDSSGMVEVIKNRFTEVIA